MQFVSESESDDEELPPPAKIPKVETSDDGDSEDEEEATEFAPTCLDEEEPQSGADDWVIGLVYSRTLARVVESHPLFGSHYLGQSVRSVARYGTNPQKVAEKRWREEDVEARRVPKRLGLLAVIREHGADALENAVIDFRLGYRHDVQAWADEQEKGMIAAYGGPLRDMHARLPQTLNLTDGGKGDVECKGQIALNNLAWRDFQLALTEFVNEHGTAYVPNNTILPSGYRLGTQVCMVRRDGLWKGWPDEKKRKSWLESLPGWTWNAAQSDEKKAALSEKTKQQFATQDARDAASEKTKQQFATQEARDAASQRTKQQFATQEARDAVSERTKRQFANETDEQRAERIRRQTEGQRRPEVRAVMSEKAKQRFAKQEARDAVSEKTKQQWASKEARDAASQRTKQQFATQEARDAASQRSKQQFATQEARDRAATIKLETSRYKQEVELSKLSEEERAKKLVVIEQARKDHLERKRRLDALRLLPGHENAKFADIPRILGTQESRDRNAESQRKAAKTKQEAKLATLSEAEQAKARVIIKRSQDKQARRKRRLEALRRIAGWEHAAQKDLPKAKAAGIVLQVCSCGVVCGCKGEGSSSGSV